MSIKFRVLGGGFRGGGECRFYFYGREDFSRNLPCSALMSMNNLSENLQISAGICENQRLPPPPNSSPGVLSGVDKSWEFAKGAAKRIVRFGGGENVP